MGPDSEFVLDCGGRLPPSEAVGLADAFERFHLLWIEEPTAEINRAAFAKIASENATPVGMGREFTSNAGFQDLLRADAHRRAAARCVAAGDLGNSQGGGSGRDLLRGRRA